MCHRLLPVFLTVVLPAFCSDQPKPAAKGTASASGVLVGRSGKPLAHARVFLGKVEDTEDTLMAKVRLNGLPVSQTDAQGKFQFTGFAPGNYTILYYPAGGPSFAPSEISIQALQAVDKSILPLMKNVEIGTTTQLDDRKWASFTLLKGHTFWGQGEHMKIWNATAKRNPSGPYLELRKGTIWRVDLTDKGQIKMDAWSF